MVQNVQAFLLPFTYGSSKNLIVRSWRHLATNFSTPFLSLVDLKFQIVSLYYAPKLTTYWITGQSYTTAAKVCKNHCITCMKLSPNIHLLNQDSLKFHE